MKPINKSQNIEQKYTTKGIKKVKSWFFKRIDNPVTTLIDKEGERVGEWEWDRGIAGIRSENGRTHSDQADVKNI